MTRFRSSASDAFYSGQSPTSYATARSTGNYVSSTSYLRLGQWYDSGWWIIDRVMLVFDTSSIPDSDAVTGVNLGLKIAVDGTTASDFTIYVYKYKWDASKGTDNVYDMGAAGSSDGNAAVQETATASVAGKIAGDWIEIVGLDPTWINKTGETRYALRSDRDANNIAPVGRENQSYYAGDHAESDRPYLDVTHGSGSTTRITRIHAQGVLGTSPLNQL